MAEETKGIPLLRVMQERLRKYLLTIDSVLEEFRQANFKELRTVTHNPVSLSKHLERLDSKDSWFVRRREMSIST